MIIDWFPCTCLSCNWCVFTLFVSSNKFLLFAYQLHAFCGFLLNVLLSFKTYGNLGSYCGSDLKSGLCCLILDFEIISMVTPKVELNSVKYRSPMIKDWKIIRDIDKSPQILMTVLQTEFLSNRFFW